MEDEGVLESVSVLLIGPFNWTVSGPPVAFLTTSVLVGKAVRYKYLNISFFIAPLDNPWNLSSSTVFSG